MAGLLELKNRFAAGDEASFAELMRITTPRLYRLARRLLDDAHEAEDLLQETYLKAYAFLATERFREEASLETWLYRIVTNGALDLLRRRRHRLLRAPPPEPVHSAEGQVEARTLLERLHQLLADLPAEQRIALVLKELEGFSSAQIARMQGCSEGAVEQRLVRARRQLKARGLHE
jgi:RNA polymerase sigma-70 factor (ECF subfamily)